jgi:hypothetical protein
MKIRLSNILPAILLILFCFDCNAIKIKIKSSNYWNSGKEFIIENGVLKGKLKNMQGSDKTAQINLDAFISNKNGNLTFEDSGFKNSCRNCKVNSSGTLSCECMNESQSWSARSELLLSGIANINGQFMVVFPKSASNIKLDFTAYTTKAILSATLTNLAGGLTTATFDLNAKIGNNNGILTWNSGGFAQSCQNCVLSSTNDSLSCKCKKKDNITLMDTTLKFEALMNNNGVFELLPIQAKLREEDSSATENTTELTEESDKK